MDVRAAVAHEAGKPLAIEIAGERFAATPRLAPLHNPAGARMRG